jgi:hypothetical protein
VGITEDGYIITDMNKLIKLQDNGRTEQLNIVYDAMRWE